MADTESVEHSEATTSPEPVPIVDRIEEQLDADRPLVEPLPPPEQAAAGSSHEIVGALRFFGLAVTLFVAVLTVEVLLDHRKGSGEEQPSGTVPAPITSAPAVSPMGESLDRARDAIARGVHSEVVRLLEPFVNTSGEEDLPRNAELHSYLARAYAALGDIERATHHRMRAMSVAYTRPDVARTLAEIDRDLSAGRFARARRSCAQLLVRADAFPDDERRSLVQAELRIAESYVGEAEHTSTLEELPGAKPYRASGGSLR